MNGHISESDIPNGHIRIGLTFLTWQRIQKRTSRARAMRLMLLLRAYVDRPPGCLIDFDILIENILNEAFAIIARIRFDVNGLGIVIFRENLVNFSIFNNKPNKTPTLTT